MSKKSERRKAAPADPAARWSGATTSPWMAGRGLYEAAPLKESVEADVCVIGAGIAGLTAAYVLAGEGKSVVVLEDGDLAGGETGRSTAHLSTALGTRYHELEELHGEPGARLIAESHAAAIDFVEKVVADEKLECGFRRLDGYLFWPQDADLAELGLELAACERAGVQVSREQRAPLDFLDTGPCLRFARQAQLDPVRYLSGLARAAARRGARIFTRSRAELLEGEPLRVRAGRGVVTARAVIVATNAPIDDRVAISSRQAAYRTYVIAAELPRGTVPPLQLWDTVDPYHYVRVQPAAAGAELDVLLVGGEDHKVGHAADAEERWARLESWTRARFPMMGAVTHRWSGQVQESADGVAFIGRHPTDPRDVFVITGDSGNGTTHGTIGGILTADLALGKTNDWSSVYDPARVPVFAAGDFLKENLDNAMQYLRYATAPDEVVSLDQIPPGCGAIVRRGLAPVAAFRREDGTVVERSAICPHLGGVVCWNQAERTWDCPVHGSRFLATGEPVTGPANEPLGEAGTVPTENPIIRAWTQLGPHSSP